MSNIFNGLKAYKGKFTRSEVLTLDAEDKQGLICEVVLGDYGMSLKFSYTEGPNEGVTYYLELDTESHWQLGETPSPDEVAVTVYKRQDEIVKKAIEKSLV